MPWAKSLQRRLLQKQSLLGSFCPLAYLEAVAFRLCVCDSWTRLSLGPFSAHLSWSTTEQTVGIHTVFSSPCRDRQQGGPGGCGGHQPHHPQAARGHPGEASGCQGEAAFKPETRVAFRLFLSSLWDCSKTASKLQAVLGLRPQLSSQFMLLSETFK